MRRSIWKRAIRRVLALATTVTLITGLFLGLDVRSAQAACGANQWSATYYTEDAEGNWVQAATSCVAAPAGSSFSLPAAPDAVKDATTYKVSITGALSGPTGWYQFTASGGPIYTVDGINPESGRGRWIDLDASNDLSIEYLYDAGHTGFTVAWSAAPACGTVSEVYVLDGASARQAAAVQCGAAPTATGLARAPADFPALTGGFTATYSGALSPESDAWYRFIGTTGSGESLSFLLDGEQMLPPGAESGYLELAAGSHNFAAVYTHRSGQTEFAVDWEVVTCETGSFLAAYYDKATLAGRASVVRCEALPGGAVVGANRSAKFTGQAYFEGGTYSFTGTGDLTLGATELSLSPAPTTRAVAEGLQEMTLEVTAGATDVTVNVEIIHTGTGVALPRCLDGLYMQELSQNGTPVLPRTCVAMPAEGPPAGYAATWTGRVWFQGGTQSFTGDGVSDLTVDGAAVSDGQVTLAEGRHDLSFRAATPGTIALDHWVTGSCPDGTFLSDYQVGGSSRFGACEARPAYAAASPPGVTEPFTAGFTSHQAILDGGLYEFVTSGNGSSRLTVDAVEGTFFDLPAVGQYAPSVGENLPEPYSAMHDLSLTYTSPADGLAAVGLTWSSPATGSSAPFCPEGLYRAEYFLSDDLSGDPFLTTCEVRPDLTHQRWGANSIRWTGRIPMEAGAQGFVLTAGGQATLYMDGAKVSEATATGGLDVQTTAWQTVSGVHEVQLDWLNTGELAFARLRNTPPTTCPQGAFTVRWYTDASLETQVGEDACEGGAPLHEWGSLEPVPGAGPAFAATWTGTIDLPKGHYRFYLQSIGGVKVAFDGDDLFVDYHPDVGYRALDLWTAGAHAADAEVTLDSSSPHTITISYAKNPLGEDAYPSSAALKFWWEPAGTPVLSAAKLQGDQVVLTYSDALDLRTKPGPTSFQVTDLEEQPVTVISTSISGSDLTLALDPGFEGDAVIVRYDPASGGSLRARTVSSLPARNLARGKSPDTSAGWKMDLGAVYLLSQVKVHAATSGYTVQTSLDGLTYTGLALPISNSTAARWIRLIPTGASLPAVESVEVWGVEAGAPAMPPAPVAGVNPFNLALGKTATMSGGGDAEHGAEQGVNGYTTRRYENRSEIWDYFSTGPSIHPWWQVDLDGNHLLTSLQIYNRADQGYEEASSLEVWVTTEEEAPAADSDRWTRVYPSDGREAGPFGGEYSPYLRIDLASVPARHVMLRLASEEEKSLELAEVQVYGVLATPSLIVHRDQTPPALAAETVAGVVRPRLDALDDYLTFHFDEDLDASALPAPDQFQVSVDGRFVTPTSVQVYQRDVTIYLDEQDRLDSTMLVGAVYTGGTIRNLSGLPAAMIPFTEAKYLAITPDNLALGKETAISSAVDGQTAGLGANGDRYGDYIQTNTESDPWWSVDLADLYSLTKVRIFNKAGEAIAAGAPLQVQTATACSDWATGDCAWETVYDHDQQAGPAFGGIKGSFRSIDLAYDNARYLRVRLAGPANQLNLAEVEVYGQPAVQIFNVGQLRPATLDALGGKVTQVGGYYPVPGEIPPPGGTGLPEYSPANANDANGDTYARLLARAAPEPGWSWQVDLQNRYLLTGLRLTLDPAAVNALVASTATSVEISTDGENWSPVFPAQRPLYSSEMVTVPIPALEARYLRIRSSDPALGDLRLYEAEVLGFPPAHLAAGNTLTNLARERPATSEAKVGLYTQWFDRFLTDPPAQGNLTNPQYNPAWAVDGNPSTYAELEPDANQNLAWTVDLQEKREALRMVIDLPSNAAAVEFLAAARIHIKVDEAWVEVDFSKTGLVSGHTVTLPLPGLKVQYVRISSDQIANLKLNEVEVYGYASALEP